MDDLQGLFWHFKNVKLHNKGAVKKQSLVPRFFAIQDESISQKETLDKEIDVVEVSQNFEMSELLTDIGVVSYKKALKIDGEVYNLYPTFDDVTGALVNISNQCNGALSAMQELYQLEAFNNATVPEYYEYLPMYTENLADSFENGTIAETKYEAKWIRLV
ncbi:hypothetical protein [Emergencia sp.]|uniref:hypothetical protein n=1 Tax=Emergencia sp. TaxID=1926557 RepID=UPI003AEFE338